MINPEGCIRFNDDDIKELKGIVDGLMELDKEEKYEYVEVNNDLDEPVTYQDRKKILQVNNYVLVIMEISQNIQQYFTE